MVFDDRLARANAVTLSLAQGLAGANASVVFATASLVGQAIGPSPAWATAPVTTFVIGTACASLPAAALARRLGRRSAYQIGASIGVLAGLLAAWAIAAGQFSLFLLATAFCGIYQAFVMGYRFGATDHASPAFRPKAISWVLLGGVAAAFVGPQLVIATKDLFPPLTFMASYLGQACVAALAILVLMRFREGPPLVVASDAPARPLRAILASRRLCVAIACGAISQASMNLIMTASPLAMVGCDHSSTQAALAIQWHIVGMFLPGLFTGGLINRFGAYRVIAAGLGCLALCGAVALSGIGLLHFNAALVLLGIGWNFSFVGASSLVAEGQLPAERTKIQGFNDLVIFSTTAVASLSSGKILAYFGWGTLNLSLFPFLALAALLLVWLVRQESRPVPLAGAAP